jgi:hypothetical protein
MLTGMTGAVRSATEQAHHALPHSFLRAPAVTGATAMPEVPPPPKVYMNGPESGFHALARYDLTTKTGTLQQASPLPKLEAVHPANAPEIVGLMLAVVLVLGRARVAGWIVWSGGQRGRPPRRSSSPTGFSSPILASLPRELGVSIGETA